MKNIHKKHVFSKLVYYEIIKISIVKKFGIIKKIFSLANKTKELYKIYKNFIKKIELEYMKENNQIVYNNFKELTHIISNPIP